MLTVWFPLMDTDAENGCLQVIPGSHRGEVLTHCSGRTGLEHPVHDPARRRLSASGPLASRRLSLSCIARRSTPHCPISASASAGASTCAITRPASRPAARPSPASSRAAGETPMRSSPTPVSGARCGSTPALPSPTNPTPNTTAGRSTTKPAPNTGSRRSVSEARCNARSFRTLYYVDMTQQQGLVFLRGSTTSEQGDRTGCDAAGTRGLEY